MVLTLKELTQISNHDSVSNVCPNFLNVESSKKIKKYKSNDCRTEQDCKNTEQFSNKLFPKLYFCILHIVTIRKIQ